MRTFAILVTGLVLAGFVRADDSDPEPPGAKVALSKLKGSWISVRRIVGGKEFDHARIAGYKFDGDKATYTYDGKPRPVMKFEVDKTRPAAFQVTPPNLKTPTKYFFKIEKDELYLIVNRSDDPKIMPDYSGKTMPVIIYKREK